jgi:2-polyprenyl-3-methyl-5-hydroxy-6-metoxy-1,4-benzoquinol methylase
MNTDYKKIYEKCFENANYNLHDDEEPRFQYVKTFLDTNKINNIIDVGSGRGNIINIVQNKIRQKIHITSTDIKKFHNFDVPFYQINLAENNFFDKLGNQTFDLLTCLDVLEHLEKSKIEEILRNFKNISKYSILSIANHSDMQNNVELHLIQENEFFWNKNIEKYFEIIGFQKHYSDRLYIYKLKSKNE